LVVIYLYLLVWLNLVPRGGNDATAAVAAGGFVEMEIEMAVEGDVLGNDAPEKSQDRVLLQFQDVAVVGGR
jgi:hypothetical protein